MSAPVIDLGAVRKQRTAVNRNTVMVQPAKGGFEIVLSTFSGYRYHLGTCESLGEARSFAQAEAFKVGRCRVQILGREGRS